MEHGAMEQATLPDVDDLDTKAKRAQPPKSTVSTSLVIGIILVVIALIICAVVSWLVWRLRRQTRQERREARQILDPDPFLVSSLGDIERRQVDAQVDEKPLPRIPSRTSTESLSTIRSLDRRPLSTFHYTPVPSVAPPVGSMSSHSRSNDSVVSDIGPTSDILRGKFTIVDVTESDTLQSQQPQMLYPSEPPANFKTEFTRGRDMPFPSRIANQNRPIPITTSLTKDGTPLTATAYPSEKGGVMNAPATPGTSYAVQIPFSQPTTPDPPFTSRRTRTPLTITASQPMSDVVVEDLGPIRRPDGTRGKGRMVVMSVLIEDEEAENSDGKRVSREPWRQESWGLDDYDVLTQVVESYAMDLPPYTPRDEYLSTS